jgi:ribonuclease III
VTAGEGKTTVTTTPDLSALAQALGYNFNKPALLAEAVTHSSLAGAERAGVKHAPDYERLEFLGDRVLGLTVAEWLLERFPDEREGALAKRHTMHVRREALTAVARRIGLAAHLRLSPGEEQMGGRDNDTILADACEAVIGALYVDGGLEAARRFVRAHWSDGVDNPGAPPAEPKTALQEWAQARGLPLPSYALVERSGPDHAPRFVVRVTVAGRGEADGEGGSKRLAERAAAAALLEKLERKSGG